jgi:hypothetical protein
MPDNTSAYTSSWFSKFFESAYFFIAATEVVFLLLNTFYLSYFSGSGEAYFIRMFLYICIGFTTISLAYSIWWHRNQKKNKFNSGITHVWLRGALRYFIAFNISLYGFGKIFKTQFANLYSRNDMPVGNLSGVQLTWNYFGYSHSFAVILGLFQISGAILLLFRRTSLLGVFVLLPVMITIILINIFYNIDIGAFGNSLIITTGLLYLLFLRWQQIQSLFFSHPADLPQIKIGILKPVLKLLTIGTALGCIYHYVLARQPTTFAGKWKILELKRNGLVVRKESWQVNSDSWCNIYIEEWGRLELSPNPYIFDAERSTSADYSYDAAKHNLRLTFNPDNVHTALDTAHVTVSNYDGKNMEWNTIFGHDTLQLHLSKVEQVKQ